MLVHQDAYLGREDESVSSRNYSSFFSRIGNDIVSRTKKLIDRFIFKIPKCQISYRAEYEIFNLKDCGDYFDVYLHLERVGSFFEPPPENLEARILK